MSAQTIKTSTNRASQLEVPRITVVMDGHDSAANSQALQRRSARSILATLPALAILVASAWAIGSESAVGFLQAALLATGLVFLVLAVGNTEGGFGALFFTGASVMLLVLLSTAIAAELAMVSAAIVAAWVSAAIIRF